MENTVNPPPPADAGQAQLRHYRARWHLSEAGPAFRTHSSWLQPVRYQGAPAMLKIAMSAEECRGSHLMQWWDGDGAMAVLCLEREALLLERSTRGRTLHDIVRQGDDDHASRILCQVAARLHRPRLAPVPALVPLARWFEALTHAETPHTGMLSAAADIATRLLAAPQEICVLHGDLHHENILDAGQRGFLAIDPKGLLGERGFDFANVFCNPDFATATAPGRLARQVAVISQAAALEPARLLAWILSWAALSAVWHLEDGSHPDTALAIAQIALVELRRANAPQWLLNPAQHL